MDKIQINTSLLQQELFELFRLQLKKDFENSACDVNFIEKLPQDFYQLKNLIGNHLIQIGKSTSSSLPGLLYRIDIGESQIKRQCLEHPNDSWEESVAELIIKRVLQKVILKKTYGKQ